MIRHVFNGPGSIRNFIGDFITGLAMVAMIWVWSVLAWALVG